MDYRHIGGGNIGTRRMAKVAARRARGGDKPVAQQIWRAAGLAQPIWPATGLAWRRDFWMLSAALSVDVRCRAPVVAGARGGPEAHPGTNSGPLSAASGCAASKVVDGRPAPAMTGAVPAVTGAVRAMTSAVRAMTGAVPAATGAVPAMTGAVPAMTGAVATMTGAVPTMTGAMPAATGAAPDVRGAVPTMTGAASAMTDAVPAVRVLCRP